MPISRQGEHIFNALGDLVQELLPMLRGGIDPQAAAASQQAAQAAIRRLELDSLTFITQRNHPVFRSGPLGDPANASRYAHLASSTRLAVAEVISGAPSPHTRGYSRLNRLYDDLGHHTIDRIAQQAVRRSVPAKAVREFDAWYATTGQQMRGLYGGLRDTALAVNRTRLR
ncbi:hypothetical protein [Pseudomonas sp. NPDC007930]|uniref:hypothetical protein n=1 Tax=Pseudomonas sp. NPDC007930 TaxID=3364417 RepID=UPI0036EF3ADE